MSAMPHELKLVIVGDGGVGKTTLLTTYANGQFPVAEYTHNILVNDQPCSFTILDTLGIFNSMCIQ